jgi:DNA ligase-1
MPDGTRFNVGTGFSDAERESPPPIGCVITYRYQELSEAGVPRFPSFVAIRDDIAFPAADRTEKTATKAPRETKAPASPQPSVALVAGKARRFELSDGASNKFWEIQLEGSGFATRYGKIGGAGQATTKSFASPAEAQKEHDKLVAEKVKKGYVET